MKLRTHPFLMERRATVFTVVTVVFISFVPCFKMVIFVSYIDYYSSRSTKLIWQQNVLCMLTAVIERERGGATVAKLFLKSRSAVELAKETFFFQSQTEHEQVRVLLKLGFPPDDEIRWLPRFSVWRQDVMKRWKMKNALIVLLIVG